MYNREPYFIFKDIDSRNMKVLVNKLPSITKPEKNIDKIEVRGRDGFLTQDYGTYKSYIKPVECTLLDINYVDALCSWLDGSGKVFFSNEPDKFYKATIINSIPINKALVNYSRFLVQFEVQPFKYLNCEPIILTKNDSIDYIYNMGTVATQPYIKVVGNGLIALTINNKTIELENIEGYVELDSEIEECFKDTGAERVENCNNKMIGEFPIFKTGKNVINFTGAVSRVEITPRWRCL